jgi:O-antigen/teichoic acid export membrane protein
VAVRAVAWGGVESAAASGVGLLLTPLVVHTAGLEGLGLWGASWSLAHTAGLVDLGIGGSYARFTARALAADDPDELNGTLAAGLGFHLVLAAAAALLAAFLGPALLERAASGSPRLPMARDVLACTLATVLLRGVLSVYRGVVAGAQRTDLLARIGAATAVLEGAGGAAALLAGFGLRGLAMTSLAAAIGTTLCEALAAHRLCPALRVRPFVARPHHYRSLLAYSTRVQVTRAFEILASHAPRLLLAAGPGLAAAGVYDLAARLAGLASTAATLPLRVVLPLAGHLEVRGDHARLGALLRHASRSVALLVVLPSAAILAFAGPLLHAWTGTPAPDAAATTARLLALAAVAAMLVAPLRLLVRGLGHAGIEAAGTAAGAIVQLALLAILARPMGAPGAALAALAGAAASTLLLGAMVARRVMPAGPAIAARAAAGAVVSGAMAAAAAAALNLFLPPFESGARSAALSALAPRLPILVAVFAGLAILVGAVGAADLAAVRDALTRPRARPVAAAGSVEEGRA